MVLLGNIRITSKDMWVRGKHWEVTLCVYTSTTVDQLRHNSRFHMTGTYDRLLRPPRTLQHYLYPKRRPSALFIYQLTECDNQDHELTLRQIHTLTPTFRTLTLTDHILLSLALTIDNLCPPSTTHANPWYTGQWSEV